MGMISNMGTVNKNLDLMLAKTRQMAVDKYKDFIWEVFKRILRETPQWSGNAVANWNISVGAPDYSYLPNLVPEVNSTSPAAFSVGEKPAGVRQKGSLGAMQIARYRNKPKMLAIRAKDKVFISNGVQGDDDSGGLTNYLDDLQDPTYWAKKLREVNKPYEVAQESLIIVSTQFFKRGVLPPRAAAEGWR